MAHPGSYYKLNINNDCNTTVHSSKSGILLMQYCQERWCGLLGLAVEHHLPNIHTYRHNLQTRKHNYHIYRNIWWPWKYHFPPSQASLFRKIPIFTLARFAVNMLTASYQLLHMSTTCKQLTQNKVKVCLENLLLPSFSLQANNELSKSHYNIIHIYFSPPLSYTCSLLKPSLHYPKTIRYIV